MLCNMYISTVPLKKTAPSEFHLHITLMIKAEKAILSHNHAIVPTIVDGITYRKIESQISSAKYAVMMDVGPFVSVGTLR
jgi:hypothetical protein